MKTAITQDFLRKLPAAPCDIYDTKLTGLVLRVRESGVASWCVVYGRGKKLTLGRADVLTPEKARIQARAVLVEASDGKDPMVERRKERAGTIRAFLDGQYAPWASATLKTGDDEAVRIAAVFPELLNRPMASLTTFQMEQWRTKRRRAGISDATINRDLDALRSVLSKAIEWKILREHPLRDVRRAKLDRQGRVRFLTPDEEADLRDALEARDEARRDGRRRFNAWRTERGYKTLPAYDGYPDHLHPMVLLALNTGLRRGELFHLKWSDVDLVACRLTVHGATAKSGQTRHVELNTEAVTTLRTWKHRRAARTDVYVFPGPQGDAMTTLKTAWLKVAKAAQLKNFTFHDLRHTFASRLVQLGVDLNTVRELLGHSDIHMTLRYAHLAPEHKAAAVAKLVAPRAR